MANKLNKMPVNIFESSGGSSVNITKQIQIPTINNFDCLTFHLTAFDLFKELMLNFKQF